ncbi:MAG: DUF4230 domain-containing protein [Elusimicrobia bacterium]|nr:DUF4230 domain-containing protein [Elusimicrobiota bacterium]
MNLIETGLIHDEMRTRGVRSGRLVIACLALAAALAWAAGRRLGPRPWTPPPVSAEDFVVGIPVPHDRLRLIVSVLELHKSVLGESPKTVLGVDLGTTKVSLSMPARVHYAVDLSGVRPVEFRLDAERRELIATFPDPQVEAVELDPSGKRVAVEAGWGRLRAYSGRAVEDALERGLYAAVKADAGAPAVVEQIKERARPLLARLLNDYLRRVSTPGPDGVTVTRVRFRSDVQTDRLAMLPRPQEPR